MKTLKDWRVKCYRAEVGIDGQVAGWWETGTATGTIINGISNIRLHSGEALHELVLLIMHDVEGVVHFHQGLGRVIQIYGKNIR